MLLLVLIKKKGVHQQTENVTLRMHESQWPVKVP